MPAITKWTKQPAELLDYDVSFADFLTLRTDTIQSHFVVVDSGIELESSELVAGVTETGNITVADSVVKVWLSGGEDKVTYLVTVTAITVGGRTKEVDFYVKVKEIA